MILYLVLNNGWQQGLGFGCRKYFSDAIGIHGRVVSLLTTKEPILDQTLFIKTGWGGGGTGPSENQLLMMCLNTFSW